MTGPSFSLRESAKQAVLWSAGLNLVRDVLQFGQMLILARLLDPTIYGMAGMATTVINFIGLASFQHVIIHALQIRPEHEVDYHQHFTAGLVLNGVLFVLANAVAFGLRFTEQYVHLEPLIHMLSLTFLLGVPVDMRANMLQRTHDWPRLRSLQLAGIVITIVSAISMAFAGAGVYALVVPGLLASAPMLFDLFAVARWRPRLRWNYLSYRETLRFGLNRAGSNAMNGGRSLLQNAMITRHAQFAGLGLYSRAEGLANMFCGRISQQVTGALYPVVTRAHAQSAQFQRISSLVLSSIAWVVTPICAFFSLEAVTLIETVYGQKWASVAPLLPLAMGCGLAISLGAAAYSLLLANDQSRLCLRSDVAAFFITAVPMIALIPLGLKVYLAGALIANAAIAVILFSLLIRTRGLHLKALVTIIFPPAVAVTLASLGERAAGNRPEGTMPALMSLLLSWLAFTVVYIASLRLFFRAQLTEIVGFLPGSPRIGRLFRL
jgi:teichuronic acid exporter